MGSETVTESDVIIEAFTELAPRYEQAVDGELRRFWGWSYDGFVDRLLELTPVNEEGAILDVATGTAVIPRRIVKARKTRGRIVGLDITLPMLKHAQRAIRSSDAFSSINLTCASAMAMPYPEETFDLVICGLATHHMDVPLLLSEMRRVLKARGCLIIADVAASPLWKLPGIKTVLRVVTFFYFLSAESAARAWAESDAVSLVLTPGEWGTILAQCGFEGTEVARLESDHFWCPAPLVLRAIKT